MAFVLIAGVDILFSLVSPSTFFFFFLGFTIFNFPTVVHLAAIVIHFLSLCAKKMKIHFSANTYAHFMIHFLLKDYWWIALSRDLKC